MFMHNPGKLEKTGEPGSRAATDVKRHATQAKKPGKLAVDRRNRIKQQDHELRS